MFFLYDMMSFENHSQKSFPFLKRCFKLSVEKIVLSVIISQYIFGGEGVWHDQKPTEL